MGIVAMQFELIVDKRALSEADRMMRRWYYWPRAILQGGYFWLLLGVMVWGLVFNLISSNGSLQRAGICALVSAALISILLWHVIRNSKKIKTCLDGINPVCFTVQANGISVTERAGNSSFTPWREFSSFREGNGIFVLNRAGSGGFQIVPKDGLATDQLDQLRSQFVAQIPAVLK